jgi:CubicO group peptidase (beta-lactamase class C family)
MRSAGWMVWLCLMTAPATPAPAATETVPPWATGWFDDSRAAPLLREGEPGEAGLLGWFVRRIDADLQSALKPGAGLPAFPGAVVLAAKNGVIVFREAVGDAVRFKDDKWTELPQNERVPARLDTIYDLASLSKLFTAVASMQLVEAGRLDLSQPVAHYLVGFEQNGKGTITIKQLLAHTSGLPPFIKMWEVTGAKTPAERVQLIYALAPTVAPGTKYVYSDLNMIVLQQIIERVSGEPLDKFVGEHVTGPLGMLDTGYNPSPAQLPRVAATEYEEGPFIHRGMVRGSVHDENAWSLGGVSGNAGLFSTAHDLAIFAQMILNGGRYGDARILKPATVLAMVSLQTAGLSDEHGEPGERGLGFDINSEYYMGRLSALTTIGHTGYTGTSLVIDLKKRSFVILLANVVHPQRLKRTMRNIRARLATDLALADPQFLVPYLLGRAALLLSGYAILLVLAQLIWRRRRILTRIGLLLWPAVAILVALVVCTACGRLF